MKRTFFVVFAALTFIASLPLGAQMRVLLIGAHPDDEDTNLIAWLQRGGRAETAYLSLTRGDGGQNLIGNELGEALGIIRTEELLAARRVDGAHQFFTRAFDFGFSKSAEETYAHWPRDSVLNDVVTVVRAWRPHVIITMFSGTPRDGHGHHQVSALLGREAFAVAGDTIRFPVSKFGPAWTPLKLYQTARFQPDSATITINAGEYNADLRRSYAEIAGESRSQHKSQGFGAPQRKGVVWNYLQRKTSRVNESTPAKSERSIFDGIDTVAPPKSDQYADVLPHVSFEAIADRQSLAIGDSALVTATIYNRSRKTIYVKPEISAVARPTASYSASRAVAPDSAFSWQLRMGSSEITRPWWLVTARNGDLFSVPLPRLRDSSQWKSMPEDERAKKNWISAAISLREGTTGIVERTPAVFRYVDAVRGEVQHEIAVAPLISVNLENVQELARANYNIDRRVKVTLRSAALKSQAVAVSLALPSGLRPDSISRTIVLDSAGTRTVTFRVRGTLAPGVHQVGASAFANGVTYNSGYIPIEYEHISPERLYRPAAMNFTAVDIQIPDHTNIGYIHGVGDNVAASLDQMGVPVTAIDPAEIPLIDLSKFTAVIVGPRAYDASSELMHNNSYLLNFARAGGTLVVQYGQYEMMRPGVMPYAISIARPHDRVTEEVAPIRLLDTSSPALRRPNSITRADFSGWVQERGLYMPRSFDSRYRPVLEVNDPGAPPNRGGIIIAPYGKGLYVYTTLAFFRQLPAGVPGAAKLFVNLFSLKNDGSISSAKSAGQ